MLERDQERLRGRTDAASLAEFQRIEELLSRTEAQEDAYWRQRAKQHWLKEADTNTKFFHRYASHRKKKNTISKLMNDNGDWLEGELMRKNILDYFNNIFTSGNPGAGEEFFGKVEQQVSQAQNDSLLQPFTVEEVKDALFAMYPDKAPGPDGMNPSFYQHFWDVVGGDVASFVINCLESGELPPDLNNTDIVLIPKKNNPELVTDLRPIALSNVVYRIIAKMMSNRMKPLMDGIISESQSAFIPDRLITDNILLAAEVGHFLNRKQCGLGGWGALKLDMAKAYDRMEWPYLRNMMTVLGFHNNWVDLVMKCVTTVSYSILVNGSRSDPIIPTRGLRQGDPLSPYLFIICAEGLSLMLQQANREGLIHGCRVARGAPQVSQLFFADDSLLFFKANEEEANGVKKCLSEYESLSGQVVNYHKSNICYSKNTRIIDRDNVAQVLGVAQAPNFGKYLGLPSFMGRNKKAAFAYIEDKIRQRIGSWNKRLLSQAVCTAIERTMNRYWWDSGIDRRIHWKAWDKLCVPKKYGGLGFKDLRAFNLAMLGKQAWRMLTKPDSLVTRVYKARYFPTGTFFDAQVGNNPSFCWRSIMAAKSIICSGVRRRIGNGESTFIWTHPWLQDEQDPMIQTEMPVQLQGARVMGLIDQQTGTWDNDFLTDLFQPEDVGRIMRIPVSLDYSDTWYWHGDPKGLYSVKSGYRRIVGDYESQGGDFVNWLALWRLKIPPKWRMFLWRAICDILPTTTNLLIKRVDVSPYCAMCGISQEDTMHALVLSSILYNIWRARSRAVWEACLPRPNSLLRAAVTAKDAWLLARPIRPPRAPPALATAISHAAESAADGGTTLIAEHYVPNLRRCRVDAGYLHDTGKATVGAVLFDVNGGYIAAFNAPLPTCVSPLMAEALACKEALSWLKERGEQNIELYTDCLTLQRYLTTPTAAFRSYVGYAIDGCRQIATLFQYCSFRFIARSDNYLAHALATSAYQQLAAISKCGDL
ncbi:PREDICTED: uncharacterized protein LOC109193404 [Ipomoea nil]|uniref:uncharacterized protein LOC109193404 n=1 Tax=Ipomoea nil TaxID=35883 RepID=UPI0009010ADB|nr:PREDICTED: uncharacterized protein LOC109193404 [Ipomoea nil]